MKNPIFVAGVAAVLAAAASMIGAASTARAAELVIGELHPITGPAVFYGQTMSRTVKLEADRLNAAGGIKLGGKTYTVRIESADDQAQATVGVAALRKLIADNVHFVIGPLASPVATAIKPIIDANPNVVQIIDGSIADGVTNGKNSFRVQAVPDTFNDAVINYIVPAGIKSVVLMTDRSHQGYMASEERMIASLQARGVKVMGREYFKIGDTDFSAQLTKLKTVDAAAIVLRGYPGEMAMITKQAHQLGNRQQIVWETSAPPATVMKNIPAAEMEGIVNCSPRMFPDYTRLKVPNALRLADAFKQRYGEDAGEMAGFSNDAFWVLVAAIRAAGSIEPAKVEAALKSLKVAAVPNLVMQFRPNAGGLLFVDGQANPPTGAQVWHGEGWQGMPGDRLDMTTMQ